MSNTPFKMKRKGFPMKSPVKHTHDGGTWETSKSRAKWGKHDRKYGEGHDTHETHVSKIGKAAVAAAKELIKASKKKK